MAEKLKKLGRLALKIMVVFTIVSCLTGCENMNNILDASSVTDMKDITSTSSGEENLNLKFKSTEEYIEGIKKFNYHVEELKRYISSPNVSIEGIELRVSNIQNEKKAIEEYQRYSVAVTEDERKKLDELEDSFYQNAKCICVFNRNENATSELRYNRLNKYTVFHDKYTIKKTGEMIELKGSEDLKLVPVLNGKETDENLAKIVDKKQIFTAEVRGDKKVVGVVISY